MVATALARSQQAEKERKDQDQQHWSDTMATAAQHAESLRLIESSWDHDAEESLRIFRKYLGCHQALQASDATSPVMIIRPLRSPVGEPIAALSDDAALFELIHSAGGRMPKEVSQ